MAHEYWRVFVATLGSDVVLYLVVEEKVARETEDASQFVGTSNPAKDRYSAPLRKPA